MGENVVRTALSETKMYDRCLPGGSQASDPVCLALRNNQLRVNRAITNVLALHGPAKGSEAADLSLTLSGVWLVGWITDWLVNPPDKSTHECETDFMTQRNT